MKIGTMDVQKAYIHLFFIFQKKKRKKNEKKEKELITYHIRRSIDFESDNNLVATETQPLFNAISNNARAILAEF